MNANASDILEARDVGPVPSQHTPAELIPLALPHDAHTGPLEPQIEAADAAEEAANREFAIQDCPLTLASFLAILSGMETITTHRKTPRSTVIGVNRDGQPIGHATKLPRGHLQRNRWTARAYTIAVPYDCYVGTFDTDTEAVAAIAAIGQTPDHLRN